jgi:hypothetical protein
MEVSIILLHSFAILQNVNAAWLYSPNVKGLGLRFQETKVHTISHGEAKQHPDNPRLILLVQ